MNAEHLSNRLAHSVLPLGKVKARAWQFLYCGQSVNWQNASVANIIPAHSDAQIVWGVCYDLSEKDFERLDEFEHVAEGHYHRTDIGVYLGDNANMLRAVTYVMNSATEDDRGRPTDEYRELCVESARRAGIDEDYIRAALLAK